MNPEVEKTDREFFVKGLSHPAQIHARNDRIIEGWPATGAGLEPHFAAGMRHTIGQLIWLDANTPVFASSTNTHGEEFQ